MKISQFYYTKIHGTNIMPAFWSAIVMMVFLICITVDITVISNHRQSTLQIFVPAVVCMTYFALAKITDQQNQIDDLKHELEEMKKQSKPQS